MGTGAQTPGAGNMIPPGGIASILPGMSPGMGGNFPGAGINPAQMPPNQSVMGGIMARPLPVPPNQAPMQLPMQGKRMMPRGGGMGARGMGM